MKVMKQNRNTPNLNILVTGGAGFLGSHLCHQLIEQGHHVTCLDNLYTGRRVNIQPLLGNDRFQFVEQDVCAPYTPKTPIDQIYHLACPASPPHYQKDPIQTTKTSVLGTLNMLELAKNYQSTILFSSTSEVYGDPLQHPQHESYWGHVNPIGIRSCYDEGKRCAETLCMDFHRQYQVDIKIARIFNTYGPNMCPQDGRVISNFIMQALQNKPITLYGDGSQSRSFCYVDDNINGLMKLMQSKHYHQPINIGNPIEYTVAEIASTIIQLTNSRSTLSYLPLPQDDPKQRRPDITTAKQILDWQPHIDLTLGLQKTIAYFEKILQSTTPLINSSQMVI